MENVVTEKEYEVQYYEIDFRKKLLVTSLMNYFEDVSTKQSEDIGGGLDYLKQKGVAWVLYKWDIHINRYPHYGEKITVQTKAYSFRKFYGYRTFKVLDDKENVIASANSIWLLIDKEKRKVIRITEDMYKMYGVSGNEIKPLIIKKIKLPEQFDIEKGFNVRYSDIDTNRHVNNVKYVDWIVETIPLDIVLNFTIKNLNITYEKEALYGEKIKIYTELKKKENSYISLHKIVDQEEKELSVIEAVWEKNEE
ncbi:MULTISPECIES: acyl-[acyl-carrier-protein] thioesterase [Clostridium]|uniref:Acyl-ACP thioesterase n=1 Tax=Clostridium ragsdalei P11 TaxID=1353534 RepID=A0A1A6B242_9CLOT|nr:MULTISPECIES: acyl-ACP thioesterase domain-containing protein [Clostridium]OBR96416.1 acyl-ACP thioesterase [Clostridium ragsdalei P11]QXE19218.1 acyl-ACP thioesterase [Clostridium sp. 001]